VDLRRKRAEKVQTPTSQKRTKREKRKHTHRSASSSAGSCQAATAASCPRACEHLGRKAGDTNILPPLPSRTSPPVKGFASVEILPLSNTSWPSASKEHALDVAGLFDFFPWVLDRPCCLLGFNGPPASHIAGTRYISPPSNIPDSEASRRRTARLLGSSSYMVARITPLT